MFGEFIFEVGIISGIRGSLAEVVNVYFDTAHAAIIINSIFCVSRNTTGCIEIQFKIIILSTQIVHQFNLRVAVHQNSKWIQIQSGSYFVATVSTKFVIHQRNCGRIFSSNFWRITNIVGTCAKIKPRVSWSNENRNLQKSESTDTLCQPYLLIWWSVCAL